MRLLKRKSKVVLLALFMLAVGVVAVVAQDVRLPTYLYHGQVRSADEWIKLVEGGVEVHCGQLPSVEVYLSDRAASDYACFDTEAELDTYWGNIIEPEWDRIKQAYPAPQLQGSQDDRTSSLLADHWAVYANSGYNTLLAELVNGASYCGQSIQIWSIAEWYSLNDINLYHPSNCTDTAFRYGTSRWSFLPWPLECGGCLSSKVL